MGFSDPQPRLPVEATDALLKIGRAPSRLALIATAFWLAVGVVAGTAQFVATWLDARPVALRDALFAPLLAGLWWVPITVAAFALVRRAPIRGPRWVRSALLHLGAAVAAPFVLNGGYAASVRLLGRAPLAGFAEATLVTGLHWFHVNVGVYLVIVAIAHRAHGRLASGDGAATAPTARGAEPRGVARIPVGSGRRTRYVDVETIDWIEGAGDYARVHCDAGEFLSNERLRALAAALDGHRFVRVHRSAIVNVDRIEELRHLSHGDYEATLACGAAVRVSRRRRPALQALLRERSVGEASASPTRERTSPRMS